MFDLRLAVPDELDVLVAIDDDASLLYAMAGLPLGLPPDHPFVLAEGRRWGRAIAEGAAWVAVDGDDQPVGFAVLGQLDGRPYLDQVAVRLAWMRRGLGTALVRRALEQARGAGELWLTTYSHLPWNGPFYEKLGFSEVPEAICGPEMREVLREQRRLLPSSRFRTAMVHRRPCSAETDEGLDHP